MNATIKEMIEFEGNIMKYIWRYRYKDGIQDLEKASWYLNKLIEITNANKS